MAPLPKCYDDWLHQTKDHKGELSETFEEGDCVIKLKELQLKIETGEQVAWNDKDEKCDQCIAAEEHQEIIDVWTEMDGIPQPTPIKPEMYRFQSKELEAEIANRSRPMKYTSKKARKEAEKNAITFKPPLSTRDLHPLEEYPFDFVSC